MEKASNIWDPQAIHCPWLLTDQSPPTRPIADAFADIVCLRILSEEGGTDLHLFVKEYKKQPLLQGLQRNRNQEMTPARVARFLVKLFDGHMTRGREQR
jgi:hypothetical protein